jgi:hypothetical protein
MSGSHNDINVLHRSSVLSRLVESNAHVVSYEINENAYNKSYYIVDGIYPDWIILVNIVCNLTIEKIKRFAQTRGLREGYEAGIWCAAS